MDSLKRVDVIINPVSGRSVRRELLNRVCQDLRSHGFEVCISLTTRAGDAARFAGETSRRGARALVIAGGDGTVSEAISGMGDSVVPLLVIPGGTENILAKYFGTRLDVKWLINVIREGREQGLNLCTMNSRRFLMVAGIGFDAEIVRRLAAARSGHIDYGSYFWPIWRTFWQYRLPRIKVTVDDELIFDARGLVFVGNVPRYALNLPIFPNARPDDGLLDVCVFEAHWQGPLLLHAVRTVLRRHMNSPGVFHRQGLSVRVESLDNAGVELDGDWAGHTPVTFQVLESQARFLVSAEWMENREARR